MDHRKNNDEDSNRTSPKSFKLPELLHRLYGLNMTSVNEYTGYWARNFHVTVSEASDNPHVESINPDGYMLRIVRYTHQTLSHIEVEIPIQERLRARDVDCPKAVPNIHGQLLSLEDIISTEDSDVKILSPGEDVDDSHRLSTMVVRLQTFIPGTTLKSVKQTTSLLYNAGEYLAKFQTALEDYEHVPLYNTSEWNLEHITKLRKFIPIVRSTEHHDMLNSIVQEMTEEVISQQSRFQKGLVHGDFNMGNIIVEAFPDNTVAPNDSPGHRVRAVIDLEEMCNGYYVYDVAIGMMYMANENRGGIDIISAAGHFLAGYLHHRCLNDKEFQSLKLCMETRFVQSLVMGEYEFSKDPDNLYILDSAQHGWTQLVQLRRASKDDVYSQWRNIIQAYEYDMGA